MLELCHFIFLLPLQPLGRHLLERHEYLGLCAVRQCKDRIARVHMQEGDCSVSVLDGLDNTRPWAHLQHFDKLPHEL